MDKPFTTGNWCSASYRSFAKINTRWGLSIDTSKRKKKVPETF